MRRAATRILLGLTLARVASAADWFVAPNGSGNGMSPMSPFGSIQQGLAAAQPGDTVRVAPGTYTQALSTVRAGTSNARITLRAETPRSVIVQVAGMALLVNHPFFTVDGLVVDGQYGASDAVRVTDAGDDFVLRNCEVRKSSRDCVDMGAPERVLIEGSSIHHCLNAAGGRTDAHGVVAAAARGLVIRDTEIHTFSGDAVQLDPSRAAPGWDDLRIEGCKLWLEPLPAPENGFAQGTVPGENALDTKTAPNTKSKVTIKNTVAYGFRAGLIGNMAAFNLKEDIIASIDGVTVYDSDIAFRLRMPAQVAIANAVVHHTSRAVRYEDGIVSPKIHASTFGDAVPTAFEQASSASTMLDVRNLLVLGSALPMGLSGSNLAAGPSAFVNVAANDYHLAQGAPPIDKGEALANPSDRDGNARPFGVAHDVGAYEWCGASCVPAPDAGAPNDGGGGGADAAPEGGALPDGGSGAPGSGGCSCSTPITAPQAPSFDVSALLALAALVARRRSRR